MQTPLFDSHCHLDFESFVDDIDEVLARARAAGVARITSIGSGRGLDSATAALGLARQHGPYIVATAGLHPHDARMGDQAALALIEGLAADPLVVAVGETGLDYYYEHSTPEEQRHVFRRMIAVARGVRKPVVVHTRDAEEDTLAILREERASDVGGIIHCFSADAAFARKALDLGFVASFSGIVTFKNAAAVREAAARQPLDALLVETDAPFLAPVPHRGRRNEPAYVAHTARCIAELRAMDEQDLRAASTSNACRVFGLPAP